MRDWKKEAENKANEEFSEFVKLPLDELLKILKVSQLGTLGSLLKAISLHGNLKDIGWPLFIVMKNIDFGNMKYHCATTLLESLCSPHLNIKPNIFLEKSTESEKAIQIIEAELARKIGTPNEI
jgi:hypothetical protein